MDIRNTCLTCGSGAFSEIEGVLVHCSKCKQSAQHVYCLEMSHVEYFQGGHIWYCGDCKGENPTSFFYDDDDRDDCETMEAEETQQISPGTNDGIDKNLKANKTTKMKKKDKKAKKKKQRESIVDKTVLEAILEGNEEAEGKEVNCDNGHELGNDEANHAPRNDLPDVADVALDTDENEDSADPVSRPTWTGALKIHNKVKKVKHIVIGGDDHLSIIACAKVLEATKFLKPEELVLDLVRRTDMWPKCYDMYKPYDKSIAFYIFPQSETDDETNGKRFKELA